MNGVATTGPQDPASKEVSTELDRNGTEKGAESGAPPTAGVPPAGATEPGSGEVPRRRRGILLGTRPGPDTPAAADDEKSLAWMATQAVKALNAVKASQLEQAQALKARGENAAEDAAPDWDEEGISHEAAEAAPPTPEQQLAAMRALNAEEVSADAASLAVQSGMAAIAPLPASTPPVQTATVGQPGAAPAVPPVEPPAHAAPPPPAVARVAASSRLPVVRPILMLGVLLMFGYTGYRYWFTGEHATDAGSGPPSTVMEPSGPELGREMAAPAISVVPAPQSAGRDIEPAAAAAGSAPANATTVAVPPAAVPEPGEPAVSATGSQVPALTVETPRPPAVMAEPVPPARPWQPAATPAEAVPAAEPAAAARQPVAEPAVAATQPASPPAPDARAEPSVRQAAPSPAPAPRPAYPAGGYGYYPPPTSWQPYYRPGYPQTPARQ